MKTIVWVHGDCLSPHNPALIANPDAPAIYVWDEALIKDYQLSLKRIVFMYECLLELPVTIRRGSVAEEVAAFAAEHGAQRIVTTASVSPRFRKLAKSISGKMPTGSRLEVMHIEPFVDYDGWIDLKRFSRYWGKARDYAFKDK